MANDALVHLIDDDEAVRESLAFLLDTAGIRTRTYESAVGFLAELDQIGSGCIITDVRMPDLDGVELLRRLNQLRKDIPVIVITGHGDVPLAVETMKLGAADFLEKPFDDQALLMAVRAALGRRQQTAEADRHKSEIRARLATLSVREEQVLRGLVAGHANKAIAFDLGISARTVEVYRANVMSKMQANSLSELVRMALLAAPDTMGHPN
jgi:two-component system response regulator FixJ